VSGANDRDDVNSTFLQPFAFYNLGSGLSVMAIFFGAFSSYRRLLLALIWNQL
jgi:hypothetical protein